MVLLQRYPKQQKHPCQTRTVKIDVIIVEGHMTQLTKDEVSINIYYATVCSKVMTDFQNSSK